MKMILLEVKEKHEKLIGLGNLVLPAALSYAVAYNTEKMAAEVKRMEKEREKICAGYAEKDEDGNPVIIESVVNGAVKAEYKISEENRKELKKELNQLYETETEVEIRKAKADLIEQCEKNTRYSIPTVAQRCDMMFMLE